MREGKKNKKKKEKLHPGKGLLRWLQVFFQRYRLGGFAVVVVFRTVCGGLFIPSK